MLQKRSKPAPLATGTGLGIAKFTSYNPDNTRPLPEVQTDYVAARYGLDGVRARLTAELAWGRA